MPLYRPPSCLSLQLQQDSNLRLSRTGLLDMSEFFIKDKDKDRYTKAASKIEIKQIQKQNSNLRLSCTGLLDMSEFFVKDKDRYTKSTTKIDQTNTKTRLQLLLDMSEFNIIDKDKDRYTKATTKTENKQR